MTSLPPRLVAFGLFAVASTAQVSVRVVIAQTLSLQAQVTGAAQQTLTVPVGTDVTNAGSIGVSSVLPNGLGGGTQLTVTPSGSPYGTTCELQPFAGYYTGAMGAVPFSSQESGAELVEFSSATPISGVLVAEAQFVPSAGYGFGTGTISCDFGDDGSVELNDVSPPWHSYSQPCTLLPGQVFVVRVQHQGALIGTNIGDYSTRATMRFVPHADGLIAYGPANCAPTLIRQFMNGTSFLQIGFTAPAPDFFVFLVGQAQLQLPMAIPCSCPQLSSAELIFGPYAQGYFSFQAAVLPPSSHLFVQIVGLNVAAGTAIASLGIHAFGQ